jgi:hypothetical protein
MGHYNGMGNDTLHHKLMNEQNDYLLEQISDELQEDRANDELDMILMVLRNSKEYTRVIQSLKNLNV